SLLDISWQEWLENAEFVLSQVLPLANISTKYVAIKLRLDPLIQVRLRRLRVTTYEELNEWMAEWYPRTLWQNYYHEQLLNRTLFKGLDVIDAICMAKFAASYEERSNPAAARIYDMLWDQFGKYLRLTQEARVHTYKTRADDFNTYMEMFRKAARDARSMKSY
ncbi:hypothetical protein IWQ61_010083, partial [Dispira simplex]